MNGQIFHITKLFFTGFVICYLIVSVGAQNAAKSTSKTPASTPVPTPTPTPERSRAIVALLNDARLAAPELAADTFLKVVESNKVTDPVWRKEILDDALGMTDEVKHSIAMRPFPIKGVVINNTEAYLFGMAYNERLDGLSLKGRVIMQMADADIGRAKRMVFEMGGEFKLKPRSCEDTLTYDIGEIYPAVAKVAKSAFTEKEIADGRRALFVAPWIENIDSPTQIIPAIDLMQQMQGSPLEKQMLFIALSRALNRNFNDDRSFTTAINWAGGPAKKIEKLIATESDFVKADIVAAYREFLLKNLRVARCKENEIKKDDPMPSFIEAANSLFPDKPISVEDIVSSELKERARVVDLIANSSDMQQIKRELISLTGAGPPDNPTAFDKTNIEWQSKVTEFVDRIPNWKPKDEISDLQLFAIRATLYGAILQVAPEGELMRTVVRRWLRFLTAASMQKDDYIHWSAQVRLVKGFLGKNLDVFWDVGAEFPNVNLKVVVAASRLLDEPKKDEPKPTPKPIPTPDRPRATVALLNDSRLAAPELAVDTFLKVVESKKVTDPAWRKEIIEEALRMIDDVQYPMPMRPAYGGRTEANNKLQGTEDYLRVFAHFANLDRLSLKGRVITVVLETDPARAKQMVFQMGGDFALKPRSCEDTLTYSTEGIYPVVIKVAKAVFTEQQVAEGQRALFVAPWIENIESPRQISAALDIVRQLQGSAPERLLLFNAASKAIDRNFKDDRSFTYSWESIAAIVGKLAAGEQDPHKSDLMNSFRGMLLKNLRGARCKDNEIKRDEPLPDYIEGVNKILSEKPITFEDISTAEYSGTPKLVNIMTKSSTTRKFREELLTVRDQKIVDGKSVKHDVNDIEWAGRVIELIERVLSFEGTDNETENEKLFLKAGIIGSMMSGIGPSDLRNSVLRKYVRLLAGSKLQKTSFIDWRFFMADAERMAPESFADIASEFPNPNLKVIVAAKRAGM